MRVDVCFDGNAYAALKLAKNVFRLDLPHVELLCDDLTFGSLADMSFDVRSRELSRLHVDPSFLCERSSREFPLRVEAADELRLWSTGKPSDVLGEDYVASLAPQGVPISHIEVDAEGVLQDIDAAGAAMRELLASACPLDASRMREIWRRMLADDASLRVVVDGMPASRDVTYFDCALRELATHGNFESSSDLAIAALDSCAALAGGPINLEFYRGRAEELGLLTSR